MIFFKDKKYLEDCPSGSIDETPMVKVDISAKSIMDELESNDNNPLEVDKETDIKDEDVEANIPATKST